MDKIQGRTAVITGAARGIGLATARALRARGATVIIGDRDIRALETALAELSPAGGVTGYLLDVTDRESFAAFIVRAKADGGGQIDILINNAGVMPVGSFVDQSQQAIRSCLEVNCYGVLNGCQLILPDMIARGSGHIINIASMAGIMAVPGQVVYAGTKYAVIGFTTAMADEVAPHGVDITAVLPPFTRTDLIAGTKSTGVGRAVGPDVVAAAIVAAIDKPRTHVAIPRAARFIGPFVASLGPRGRRWINKRTRADRIFLDDMDQDARRIYEQRAETSIGLDES
ncbi:SDR family oxidoreductase [Mycobacterium sp. WUMAC-067]|uniref:SDR family oxidoreductase n=1 Tax=unclassified Mycobacterium TaxID=2642494 RepID=UPI001CDA1382|nr:MULTISPECIES: SDR family oxidoreductase [unclassified Mycobacterium]MCA2244776.1 SDR family oxidoreductase [Mycobacterium sp. WUMAC-067]MCA2315986.1 SDR family oxidoreductase [Mycobacterium sp. WUMAC-025]